MRADPPQGNNRRECRGSRIRRYVKRHIRGEYVLVRQGCIHIHIVGQFSGIYKYEQAFIDKDV